jgi:hypothetical protein
MLFRHLVSSLLLATLIVIPVAAQSTNEGESTVPDEAQKAQSERVTKALQLLDQVIAEADTLKLAENRLRIQTSAAALLWTRNEPRARALFKTATNGLVELINTLDVRDPQYLTQRQAPAQLRQEMLQQIAAHDAQLALEFVRATRMPPQSQEGFNSGQPDQELQLELELANQIAFQNPKLALEIAEAGLRRGVTYQMTSIIAQLQNKDRDAAASLTGKVVKRLIEQNLLRNNETAGVAINLLNMLRQMQSPNDAGSQPNENSATSAEMLAAYRELLEAALNAALNPSSGSEASDTERNAAQNLLMGLQQLVPQIEKDAPARAPELQRRIANLQKTLNSQGNIWAKYQQIIQRESVDVALAAIEKAPPENRNNLYQQLAWKAFSAGEIERARQIVNEHVTNPVEQQQMLQNMDQQIAQRMAGEGKIEEAHQLLSRIRSKEERVSMLVQLAATALGKDNQKVARQLLEEASGLVSGRAENYSQMQAQLAVAGGFGAIDPARSFQLLDNLASQLNELASAAEVLNNFEQQYFREGELLWQNTSLGNMTMQHINTLASLAQKDFAQSNALAGKFQHPEARLMARLQIAQEILTQDEQQQTGATNARRIAPNFRRGLRGNRIRM